MCDLEFKHRQDDHSHGRCGGRIYVHKVKSHTLIERCNHKRQSRTAPVGDCGREKLLVDWPSIFCPQPAALARRINAWTEYKEADRGWRFRSRPRILRALRPKCVSPQPHCCETPQPSRSQNTNLSIEFPCCSIAGTPARPRSQRRREGRRSANYIRGSAGRYLRRGYGTTD
jgi:hypothetical protein